MTDWEDVVEQHGPLVWRTAWRLLGNDADASDCFQKVFLDAVRITRRQPVRQWPALLSRMATARSLDLLRERYRRQSRSQPLAGVAEEISDESVSTPTDTAELSDHLRRALTQLPQQQAEVVCLRGIDEMTYEEIAERLDIKVSYVGVLLNRARKRLKQLLKDAGNQQVIEQEKSP